jgi:hypothetical protein
MAAEKKSHKIAAGKMAEGEIFPKQAQKSFL